MSWHPAHAEGLLNTYIFYRLIGQVGRVFANGPEDLGSIPRRVIPKTFKMVRDTSMLNTHQYKVRGGARGVVVIVVGNGHGDTSSNPGRD